MKHTALLFIFLSLQTYAFDSEKCSKMLNNGLYAKYKWGGIGPANSKAARSEIERVGSARASTNTSVEASTALLDPKYYSNVTTSDTQSTSSWGSCSLVAIRNLREKRDLYVAQNIDQIRKDMANGAGGHLDVIAWYSLCEDQVLFKLNTTLQNNFDTFDAKSASQFNQTYDKLVSQSKDLKGKCFNLTSI